MWFFLWGVAVRKSLTDGPPDSYILMLSQTEEYGHHLIDFKFHGWSDCCRKWLFVSNKRKKQVTSKFDKSINGSGFVYQQQE